MKRKLLFLVSLIIFIIISINAFIYMKSHINSDIIENLEGQIYYTIRVDGVKTLFKSDANLRNKKLVYSHKGKGKDSYGSYNDNILDYYYDIQNGTISFIAMNNGEWSLFSLKENNSSQINKAELVKDSTSIKNIAELSTTDYIKQYTDKYTILEKKGSIYLIENGQEKCIKNFYGIYDSKFTGYTPMGFSPDGKYLIYHSMEHLTPLGTIVELFINDSYGHNYIMDLSTGKSTRFIDSYEIQWIIN